MWRGKFVPQPWGSGASPCPSLTTRHSMPSSTRPETLVAGNPPDSLKRSMSDPESIPQDPKKARRDPSADPSSSRRDAIRDAKRRKKKKKKTPIVSASTPRDEVAQARPDSSSRTPLATRNDIIRFTSDPPAAALQTSPISDAKDAIYTLPSNQSSKSRTISFPRENTSKPQPEAMTSTSKGMRGSVPDGPQSKSSSALADKVAKLEAELQSKNSLIASHHTLLSQVQQAVTCQVCLDLMYKPYALAPCGHIACHGCLVNWFTAPPPDSRPAPPAMMRRKTCPHCRAVVRERPVEVWGVKSIAQAIGKSELLPNQLPAPLETSEKRSANVDPWKDIFPKSSASSYRELPWVFPGAYVDDDDIHIPDGAPRGEGVGMLDMEDGGIYRCLDCMHEIWDGICTSCGRIYPGHRRGDDDDDDDDGVYGQNAMGWLEDQMGAEEVDVADDPGWMGLEDGEADDDGGDIDDWRSFDPVQQRFFRPWAGFIGTIHVDEGEEEEEDDIDGRIDDLQVLDEDDEGEDEGYESSFIDDGDERGEIGGVFDGPRFYEIGDDEQDEDHRAIDLVSDEDRDEEDGGAGDGCTVRRRAGLVLSSDGEDGHHGPYGRRRQRRGHGVIESDGSDDWGV